MSAEIINLNAARKSRARAAKQERAAENRTRHGRTKAEKDRAADDNAKAKQQLDSHKPVSYTHLTLPTIYSV